MIGGIYTQKAIDVMATQWNTFGDHPEVINPPWYVRAALAMRYGHHKARDIGWLPCSATSRLVFPGAWVLSDSTGRIETVDTRNFSRVYRFKQLAKPMDHF